MVASKTLSPFIYFHEEKRKREKKKKDKDKELNKKKGKEKKILSFLFPLSISLPRIISSLNFLSKFSPLIDFLFLLYLLGLFELVMTFF